MKRILVVSLLLVGLATPATAKHLVYLKEGGVISAKSAWRSKGKVYVLVNRDTLTEFTTAEIDMKRTFATKTRKARRKVATPRQAGTSQPVQAAQPTATPTSEKKKAGVSLPSLPSLPERNPSALQGGEEGAIRKQKREMKERLEE